MNVGVDARKRTQPVEQRQERDDIGRKRAGIEAPCLALLEHDVDDHADGAGRDKLHDRRACRACRGLLAHRLPQSICPGNRSPTLVILAAEDLDHALPADDFLERLGNRSGALLDITRDTPQPSAEVARHRSDQRQHHDGDERQLPVEPEQEGDATGDGERAPHRGGDCRGSCRRQLVRVEGELGYQPTRRLRVVIGGGQHEQVVDHALAQIEYDAMTGPGHAVFRHEGADATQQEHRNDGERQSKRCFRLGMLQLLHDRHDHVGHQYVARRDDDHADDGQRERPPVGTNIGKQPPVEEHAGRHGDRTRAPAL